MRGKRGARDDKKNAGGDKGEDGSHVIKTSTRFPAGGPLVSPHFQNDSAVRWLSLAQGSNKRVTRWQSRKKGWRLYRGEASAEITVTI
jgi:hypothetical protein